MGEVMNEGRFDAWRHIMDPMTPEPEGTSASRLVIGKLIDEAESAAQQIASFRAALGEVQLTLGLKEEADNGPWEAPMTAPMTMFGVRSQEVRCGYPEPHDAHGVDMGTRGFWCPGVPLVEEADEEPQEEGYARFTVSTPMPPGNDGQFFTGVASLTTDTGETFVTSEYAAALVRETERHNEELREALAGARSALGPALVRAELLKRQVLRQAVDQTELDHLREFKRVTHEALDEAGVSAMREADCRVVARIEALAGALHRATRR